jgi:hypothetical protein
LSGAVGSGERSTQPPPGAATPRVALLFVARGPMVHGVLQAPVAPAHARCESAVRQPPHRAGTGNRHARDRRLDVPSDLPSAQPASPPLRDIPSVSARWSLGRALSQVPNLSPPAVRPPNSSSRLPRRTTEITARILVNRSSATCLDHWAAAPRLGTAVTMSLEGAVRLFWTSPSAGRSPCTTLSPAGALQAHCACG